MKKIIISILAIYLFAQNQVIINKKEIIEENKTISEEIILRKWLINKINSLLPNYIQATPKDNMLEMSVEYNTKNKKITSKLNIKLIFPSLEGKINKYTQTKTKELTLKLIPILQIYKQLPTLTIKTSFTYSSQTLIKNFTFDESIYYYTTFKEYKEITSLLINKFIDIDNLSFKISKTYLSSQKSNMFYKAGIYYYTTFYKFIRIYGIEIGGERKKLPFIYWYKPFFTYRHTIFNKRYLFTDITPYILISKEFNFTPKLFVNLSLNLKF